jgi:hypothetical protein
MPTLGWAFSATLFYQGDVVRENQFRRLRDRQKLVRDWILWPWAGEVKEKSSVLKFVSKRKKISQFLVRAANRRIGAITEIGPREPVDFSLRR